MKKAIPCILLAAICLNLFACGQEIETTNETTVLDTDVRTTEEEKDYLKTLPMSEFPGETFRMLGVDYATRRNFPNEEEMGDIVNDALYARDHLIADIYKVEIEYIPMSSANEVTSAVRQSVLADDDEYDILISDIESTMTSLMREKLLYDINSLPTLDPGAPWWSADMAEETSVNGKLFITMGDISPMKYYAPYVMAFNKRLIDEYTDHDIYDLVVNGKWTNDVFYSIIKDANRDLDGDGVIDKKDFHGYAHVDTAITALAHFTGAGQTLSDVGKDGTISVRLNTENAIDLMERIGKALRLSGGFDSSGGDQNPTVTMFKEGRALFFGNSYSLIIATFRDMADDFGVIPVPKGSEEQEDYHSYINTWCLGGVAFPSTIKNIEMIGLVSEAMGYLSYRDVRNALYDTTMKVKISRDDINAKILDMIFDNTYIDMNGLFNLGGSTTLVFNTISNGTEFSSAYASREEKIAADIEKLRAISDN